MTARPAFGDFVAAARDHVSAAVAGHQADRSSEHVQEVTHILLHMITVMVRYLQDIAAVPSGMESRASPPLTTWARPVSPRGTRSVITSAERARHAAWVTGSQPAWSPHLTAASRRHVAATSTVTSHHCEILLRSLAVRIADSGTGELSASLLRGAAPPRWPRRRAPGSRRSPPPRPALGPAPARRVPRPDSAVHPRLPVSDPGARAHDPGVADVSARHWLRSASATASRLICVLNSSSSSSICFSVELPS